MRVSGHRMATLFCDYCWQSPHGQHTCLECMFWLLTRDLNYRFADFPPDCPKLVLRFLAAALRPRPVLFLVATIMSVMKAPTCLAIHEKRCIHIWEPCVCPKAATSLSKAVT